MEFKKKKSIVLAAVFVACMVIGFVTTYLLKRSDYLLKRSDVPKKEGISIPYTGGEVKKKPEGSPIENVPKAAPTSEETIVKDTSFVRINVHRKTVNDTIMDITYRVRYVGKIQNSKLVNVRAKDSTIVKRTYVRPKPASAPVPKANSKMSSSEMKQMLKSGSYAGRDKITQDFRIIVIGQKSGEKMVESSMDVHDKIKFGQWQDITVIGMTYDNDGCVSEVRIKPVYFNN